MAKRSVELAAHNFPFFKKGKRMGDKNKKASELEKIRCRLDKYEARIEELETEIRTYSEQHVQIVRELSEAKRMLADFRGQS